MALRMSTAISDALRAIEVCASTWHDNLFRYFIWEVWIMAASNFCKWHLVLLGINATLMLLYFRNRFWSGLSHCLEAISHFHSLASSCFWIPVASFPLYQFTSAKIFFYPKKNRTVLEFCCSICQFKTFFYVRMTFCKKCCEKATALRAEMFAGTNFQVTILQENFFPNFCPKLRN